MWRPASSRGAAARTDIRAACSIELDLRYSLQALPLEVFWHAGAQSLAHSFNDTQAQRVADRARQGMERGLGQQANVFVRGHCAL